MESLWITDDGARRYRVKRTLGTGGEGRTFLCETPVDETSGAVFQVAVKQVIHPDPVSAGIWLTHNEKLRHIQQPGLVRVRDLFLSGPPRYLDTTSPERDGLGPRHGYVVMDYLGNLTLQDRLNDMPDLPMTERITMLIDVAAALDALHGGDGGVEFIHGDVKPANIMVNADGAGILVDVEGLRTPRSSALSSVSQPYLAPELAADDYLPTVTSDRFAFYATTAHLLLGEVPPVKDGTLDVNRLLTGLRKIPALSKRHSLLEQLRTALQTAPDRRPAPLATWLNSLRAAFSKATDPVEPTPIPPQDSSPSSAWLAFLALRRARRSWKPWPWSEKQSGIDTRETSQFLDQSASAQHRPIFRTLRLVFASLISLTVIIGTVVLIMLQFDGINSAADPGGPGQGESRGADLENPCSLPVRAGKLTGYAILRTASTTPVNGHSIDVEIRTEHAANSVLIEATRTGFISKSDQVWFDFTRAYDGKQSFTDPHDKCGYQTLGNDRGPLKTPVFETTISNGLAVRGCAARVDSNGENQAICTLWARL